MQLLLSSNKHLKELQIKRCVYSKFRNSHINLVRLNVGLSAVYQMCGQNNSTDVISAASYALAGTRQLSEAQKQNVGDDTAEYNSAVTNDSEPSITLGLEESVSSTW